MGIILADTSAIRHFMDLEAANEARANASDPQFTTRMVIDALCITDKNRTIVMSDSVLSELFRIKKGKKRQKGLKLANNSGPPAFPLGRDPADFPYPHEAPLYEYFSQLANDGHIRAYNNHNAMFNYGELTPPKGGIVFVKMRHFRKSNGLPNAGRGDDAADRDIAELVYRLNDYGAPLGLHGTLVLNHDAGLSTRVFEEIRKENLPYSITNFAWTTPLLAAMVNKGMLPPDTLTAVTQAYEEMAKTNPLIEKYLDQATSPRGQKRLRHETQQIMGWLEGTKAPEQQTRPTEPEPQASWRDHLKSPPTNAPEPHAKPSPHSPSRGQRGSR